ncbi:hypothetical protein HGB07_01435 [Candidatus Roizmanbacteria bacterium]|nr:hypothetical protein [Candidatus Roizmanbacteria bacterium]
MEGHYTALDIKVYNQKFASSHDSRVELALLSIGIITALVLAMLLFLLIQKNMQTQEKYEVTPAVIPTVIVPTVIPSGMLPSVSPINTATSAAH